MFCHETELQCAIANALADLNRLQKRFFFIAMAKMHEEMKSWMVAWNRWLDSLIANVCKLFNLRLAIQRGLSFSFSRMSGVRSAAVCFSLSRTQEL